MKRFKENDRCDEADAAGGGAGAGDTGGVRADEGFEKSGPRSTRGPMPCRRRRWSRWHVCTPVLMIGSMCPVHRTTKGRWSLSSSRTLRNSARRC